MKDALIPQQHNSKQQGTGSISKILHSLPICVRLPVRINLWLQPNHTLLNSLTEPVELYLSPQELRTIETRTRQRHFTVESALVEYLKQEIKNYVKWQELIEQVHQRYGKDASAIIDVELLGRITWNGSLLNVS